MSDISKYSYCGLLPDWVIQDSIKITPLAGFEHRPGVISYGLTSYGYDARIGTRFKIFHNAWGAIVDPKALDPKAFVDFEGEVCIIPPNSFVLGETVEQLPSDFEDDRCREPTASHEQFGQMRTAHMPADRDQSPLTRRRPLDDLCRLRQHDRWMLKLCR